MHKTFARNLKQNITKIRTTINISLLFMCQDVSVIEEDSKAVDVCPVDNNNDISLKKSRQRLKLLVFRLQEMLTDNDMFAEEFVASSGMEVLIFIVEQFSDQRNIQSYALNALCKTMMFLNALEYLRQQPNVLSMFLQFLRDGCQPRNSTSVNIIVIRQSLFMLTLLCQHLHDGYRIIKRCVYQIADCAVVVDTAAVNNCDSTAQLAIENALKKQRSCSTAYAAVESINCSSLPYFEVVNCLHFGDLDVRTNALKFINTLIKHSGVQWEKRELCNALIAVGLMDHLLVQYFCLYLHFSFNEFGCLSDIFI